MWSYDIPTETWTLEKMYGETPSPRSGYASCAIGDRIYMFGGEGESQMLHDFFVFDTTSNEWTDITGTNMPPARKDACMACHFPTFALFGGTTANGYNGDLYYIDLAHNVVELLSDSQDSNSPGLRAHSECWAEPLDNGDIDFLVAIGETVGEVSYSTLYTYSLLRRNWRNSGETESRSQAAAIKANDRLLFAGGERFGFDPYSQVFSFDLKTQQTTIIGSLPRPFYNGGSCYVKTSLYLQGGADTSTKKFRSDVPSRALIRIDMNEDCGSLACDWPCSAGTYQTTPGKCEFCPKGTYNPEQGASECLKCPKGTASNKQGNSSILQCYPCSEGYFTSTEGTTRCLKCPNNYTCSVGNSVPKGTGIYTDIIKSSQPSSYITGSKDVASMNSSFLLLMISIGIVIILFFLVSREFKWFAKIDLYNKLHNHFVDEPMYVRDTALGGLFSVLFSLVALIFIFTALTNYSLDNIAETKALVPMITLDEDFDKVMKR
jgi:hypothetical protein